MDYWPYREGFSLPLNTGVVKIPEEFTRNHTLVLGKTGSGKSNLLAHLIDIYESSGKTVIVFDSHGELWKYRNRNSSIISLTPLQENGIGFLKFNMMGVLPYKNGTERLMNEDMVIFTLKDIFSNEDIFSHGTWGPRIEMVFTILPRLMLKYSVLPTISDMVELLLNYLKRKDFASSLDSDEKLQFYSLFNQGYDFISSTVNKLLPLLSGEVSKNAFSSRIDFYDISRFKGTLYIDLSPEHSSMAISKPFATMLLYKIWNNVLLGRMKNVVLVIDEFQTFSPSLTQRIVNEGRKFGLWLTAATQSLLSINPVTREALKTNTHNFFLFQLSPEDEKTIRGLGKNFINPPFHSFYALIPRNNNHFTGSSKKHPETSDYRIDRTFYDFNNSGQIPFPSANIDPFYMHILLAHNLVSLVDDKILPTDDYLRKMGARMPRGRESIYHRYLITYSYFFFKEKGYEVYENIVINGRKPDLVLVKDGSKIPLECEFSDVENKARIEEKNSFYSDLIFATFKGFENKLPRNRKILLIPPIGDMSNAEMLSERYD